MSKNFTGTVQYMDTVFWPIVPPTAWNFKKWLDI